MMPDITNNSLSLSPDQVVMTNQASYWIDLLSQTAQQRKATAAASKSLNAAEVEELARAVFSEIAPKARQLSK